MGAETEEVTVKVASVPGVRLQVYFMDHPDYFSRDGLTFDDDGEPFDDNPRRALFFDRAVIETIRTLRWGPDVIHSFGWIAGLLPMLLATEYAGDDVLGDTKTAYTPDGLDPEARFTEEKAAALGLSLDDPSVSLTDLGVQYADATIFPPDLDPTGDADQFSEDADERIDQLVRLYEQMLSEVPA
jgi:starch synthase